MTALHFILFFAVHVFSSFPETTAFPRELKAFLERIGLDWYTFVDKMLFRADRVTSTTQYDETTQLRDSNDAPAHSSGVITDKTDGNLYILREESCAPRPTAVRVPRNPGYLVFPDYVMLHRCTGGCPYLQGIHHCTVTHQTEITVSIFNQYGLQSNVTMYNHTSCTCDCIKSASDCDPMKEWWSSGTCSCKCRSDGSQCNSSNQNWNSAKCQCECNLAVGHCENKKEWDHVNCGCHCRKKDKDKCDAKNKKFDLKTCDCV